MPTETHVYAGKRNDIDAGALIGAHADWLLRASLACVFLFHGLQKFLVPGIAGFAAMMGLPIALAFLVALVEVLAGTGILAGAAVHGRLGDRITRLSGLATIPVMVGAIAMVHWGRWSFTTTEAHPMGGMEFQVVLLLIGLYFVIRGNDA